MTRRDFPAQIKRMVLKDGYIPVAQGLALGVFIGFTGRAIIRSYMDADISIVDPWMFLVVPIPLILAAFCACYWPARACVKSRSAGGVENSLIADCRLQIADRRIGDWNWGWGSGLEVGSGVRS